MGVFDLTLTFDNGPEPGVTPRVLDVLRERGISTTFFVIGEKLGDLQRRRLATRAHDEGHWIGNHTFTHPFRSASNRYGDRREGNRPDGRRRSATSPTRKRWFRPFGGGGNLDTRLLKPSVVDYLGATNIAACSGTLFRAIGTIPTTGSSGRWSNATRSRGA
jgi:peptidoglycan/xylan/chitin deacetylase (PgdA/CDA1 family)